MIMFEYVYNNELIKGCLKKIFITHLIYKAINSTLQMNYHLPLSSDKFTDKFLVTLFNLTLYTYPNNIKQD